MAVTGALLRHHRRGRPRRCRREAIQWQRL